MQTLEGKKTAFLYGLKKLAAHKPREAALLTKLIFDKGDLITRLAALKTVALSSDLGNGALIGDFFVRLMGATTAQERREILEPFFEKLFAKSPRLSKEIQGKLAWLEAYYKGWREENLN